MAKKKAKRSKAYNPVKRLSLLAKSALNGHAVIFIGGAGESKCNMVDIRRKHIYSPAREIAEAVEKIRFKWSIYCAVFCRDQLGEEYMKGGAIVSNEEYRQSELADFVQEFHTDIIRNQVNPMHVVNVGWIATPDNCDFDEKVVGDIFATTDAWDYLSKWEYHEQQKQE